MTSYNIIKNNIKIIIKLIKWLIYSNKNYRYVKIINI